MSTSIEVINKAGLYRLVIETIKDVADGVREITLCAALSERLPDWTPGAHIDVYIPGGGARQYSLCGDPTDNTRWTFAVQHELHGRGGSAWLHSVLPGAVIEVGVPRNHFPLQNAAHYYFVAGGIGITPVLAMIKSLPSSTPWRLLFGGRSCSTMAYAQEMQAFGGSRVQLCPQDVHGLPDLEAFVEGITSADAIYACGPPAMLRELERLAETWPSGLLHVERFAPLEVKPLQQKAFDVVLAKSCKTVRVEAHESITQALARCGIHVTTVCGEGVCGTCETRVLEGLPEHRDSVLSNEERAACNTMMLCCSRALTDRLVLDM